MDSWESLRTAATELVSSSKAGQGLSEAKGVSPSGTSQVAPPSSYTLTHSPPPLNNNGQGRACTLGLAGLASRVCVLGADARRRLCAPEGESLLVEGFLPPPRRQSLYSSPSPTDQYPALPAMQNCGAAGTNSILLGGAADYLAPVSCSVRVKWAPAKGGCQVGLSQPSRWDQPPLHAGINQRPAPHAGALPLHLVDHMVRAGQASPLTLCGAGTLKRSQSWSQGSFNKPMTTSVSVRRRYQFAVMVLAAVLLAKGVVHKSRYALIGLLMPVTYLLTSTWCAACRAWLRRPSQACLPACQHPAAP